MSTSLSSQDLRNVNEVQELLLQPADQGLEPQWILEVNASLRRLLSADSAALVVARGRRVYDCFTAELPSWYVDFDRQSFFDDAGVQRAVAGGESVWTQEGIVAGDWSGYRRDPGVNEILRPAGICDAIGYLIQWPEEGWTVGLTLGAARERHPPFDEKGAMLLDLVQPAFRSAFRSRLILSQSVRPFLDALDLLRISVALLGDRGRLVHMNPAFRDMLSDEPEREMLLDRLRHFGRRGTRPPAASKAQVTAVGERRDLAQQMIRTAKGTYRMSATRANSIFGREVSSLLILERVGHPQLSAQDVARFGLTKREFEIAILIKEGHSNARVAALTQLSEHTVKRHVERILHKLKVESRSMASALLNRIERDGPESA